ncbi:hypothetical protein OIV83_000394 [Microbotryomycetes sp. JL201]|nr:hypothetical protein OIV83_000394 [Microbotryomycetes sp. JL201]
MDRLPQEILNCILDALSTICLEEPLAGAGRSSCLRSAALVSRRWSEPAQRTLYQVVDIGNDSQARLFMASAASKRWPINDLTLSSAPELSAWAVAAVLDVTPSVRTLDLNTLTTELHEGHLVCPSLKDLEMLLVNKPLVYMPFYEPPFPFTRLRRLVLGNREYSPQFCRCILAVCSDSLQSLTFAVGSKSPGFKALLENFGLVAAGLQDLGLWFTPANARYALTVSSDDVLSYLPDLSHCHQLKSFRLVGYPPSMTGLSTVLSTLPTHKLKHVQTFSYHLRGEAFSELAKCVRLEQLRNLRAWQHTTPSEVAQQSAGFVEFLLECHKRKIQVSSPY